MEVNTPRSIAILGAGITGLTAAHRLHRLGHRVRIFEQSSRVGGAIGTEITEGWLIERGPNSLLENHPAATALITELDLDGERVLANPTARKRFIVRNGRPLPVPLSPPAFLTSPLFSFGAKLRLLRELGMRPRTRPADISLEQLVGTHFGPEIVDYALNPFVAGVYAGDPERLSARHAFPQLWEAEQTHGSLLRAQIARARQRRTKGEPAPGIVSFRRGLQTLTDALAARLPVGSLQTNAKVEHLTASPQWTVTWHDGHATHAESFDTVVSALPASGLAGLRIGPENERPLAPLANIAHPPVASLYLGFHRSQITHPLDGFGLLVPARESHSCLGVIFSSSLFADRAPAGHVALTVLVGGTRQPELAVLPADELLDRVLPDLTALLGVQGTPLFLRHGVWPRAIPQYDLGYERHLTTLTACEQAYPGLWIGGQVRDGISLPACIAAGEKLAARVVSS